MPARIHHIFLSACLFPNILQLPPDLTCHLPPPGSLSSTVKEKTIRNYILDVLLAILLPKTMKIVSVLFNLIYSFYTLAWIDNWQFSSFYPVFIVRCYMRYELHIITFLAKCDNIQPSLFTVWLLIYLEPVMRAFGNFICSINIKGFDH